MGRPLADRPDHPGAAPLTPVLKPLEGVPARGVPYDQLAVQHGTALVYPNFRSSEREFDSRHPGAMSLEGFPVAGIVHVKSTRPSL